MCRPIVEYKSSSRGQRSDVRNFQSLLPFAISHIAIKLHQFLTSVVFELLLTAQTDRRTDIAKTLLFCQHSGRWRAGNNLSDAGG